MLTDALQQGGKEPLQAIRADLLARPDFMTVRQSDFLLKLAEQAAIIGLGVWLAVGTGNLLAMGLGIFLLGAAYARNLELVHECIHYIAFRRRLSNKVWGAVLALPMLTSFEEWRYAHLRHHADVRNEGFQFTAETIGGPGQILSHFFMLDYYRDAVRKMAQSVSGGVAAAADIRSAVNRDYQFMLAAVLAAVALSFLWQTWLFALVWLLPLAVASVINFHIQLPEHYQCETAAKDAMRNSRTIEAGRFAAWYVNSNNLHTSHHWIPTAPIRQLREIDAAVRPYIETAGETYPAFYARFYRQLWTKWRAGRPSSSGGDQVQ